MHAFLPYGVPMLARSDNERHAEVRMHANKRPLTLQTPPDRATRD